MFNLPFSIPFGGGRQVPSTGPAARIDSGLAALPLLAVAQREAPGMTREGAPAAGSFREGQTLEQAFRMLPGRCYTVVATGTGISQLEVSIVTVTPIPQASGVIAQTTGTSSAVLGGQGNCVRWDLPVGIHAKYVVRAARGQGMASSQLFSR
jgi:hypothetical protein